MHVGCGSILYEYLIELTIPSTNTNTTRNIQVWKRHEHKYDTILFLLIRHNNNTN